MTDNKPLQILKIVTLLSAIIALLAPLALLAITLHRRTPLHENKGNAREIMWHGLCAVGIALLWSGGVWIFYLLMQRFTGAVIESQAAWAQPIQSALPTLKELLRFQLGLAWFMAPALGWMVIDYLNVVRDRSPTVTYRVSFVEKQTRASGPSQIVVTSWRQEGDTERLRSFAIPSNAQIPGKPLTISLRQGAYWQPYVTQIVAD